MTRERRDWHKLEFPALPTVHQIIQSFIKHVEQNTHLEWNLLYRY